MKSIDFANGTKLSYQKICVICEKDIPQDNQMTRLVRVELIRNGAKKIYREYCVCPGCESNKFNK